MKFRDRYWIIVIFCFALVVGVAFSAPSIEEIYKNKKNEHISYIANMTGVSHVELYVEHLDWCGTIDLSKVGYLDNQTFPLVEDYVVNELIIGDNWIYLDIEFWVDKELQRDFERVAIVCIDSETGELYIHELLK